MCMTSRAQYLFPLDEQIDSSLSRVYDKLILGFFPDFAESL